MGFLLKIACSIFLKLYGLYVWSTPDWLLLSDEELDESESDESYLTCLFTLFNTFLDAFGLVTAS